MDVQLSEKRRRSIQMREEGFQASPPTFPLPLFSLRRLLTLCPIVSLFPQAAKAYKAIFPLDDFDRKVEALLPRLETTASQAPVLFRSPMTPTETVCSPAWLVCRGPAAGE
jgi:hypothetical protein